MKKTNFSQRLIVLWTILLLTYCFFLNPNPVLAHILQTDHNIGAVLHIDPDDDPIVGEPTHFLFEFKDKNQKFTPEQCECTVLVVQHGKVIHEQSLLQDNLNPSLTNTSFMFSFPQKDVYQIQISGKPMQINSFQPFHLIYDIRVARDNVITTSSTGGKTLLYHTMHYGVFAFGFVVIILIIMRERFRKK